MLSLRSLLPGAGQQAEPGFDDALKALLVEANGVIDERRKLLATIKQTQATLAEAEEQLSAARNRQGDEEYKAAQTGLAIATEETQEAVADAALRAKSERLRLKGLESERARLDAATLAVWHRIEAWRDQFFQARMAELQGQFGAVILEFFSLLCRAKALRNHHAIPRMNAAGLHIFDPIQPSNPSVCAIGPNVFWRADGKIRRGLEKNWLEDGSACELDVRLRSIEDQIAPLSATVGELRKDAQE